MCLAWLQVMFTERTHVVDKENTPYRDDPTREKGEEGFGKIRMWNESVYVILAPRLGHLIPLTYAQAF